MKKIILILFFFTVVSYAQWVQVSNGMGNLGVTSLAYNGNYIFAGAGNNGVYLSSNDGSSWTQTSLNNRDVRSLAANGNEIFAGTFQFGIYLSANNGSNWTQAGLNNLIIYSLAANGNNIFAGTPVLGVYLSSDNGSSWTQTSLNNRYIYSLAVYGHNIFAGTNIYGVYLSTDNGTSWAQSSLNNYTIRSLTINGSTIFAGTNSVGVYKSTDNGTSWIQTSLNNQNVYSLAADGFNIFAGTYQNGVFVSNDNGDTWTQRNESLNGNIVTALCIYNNYIFAGTDVYGVYRRPLNEVIGIIPISHEVPNQFSLSQNYPNPFNPSTVIKFQVASPRFVKLSIYDALGREVESIVNEQLNAGTYEADWDGINFPSGIYFYKLTAGDYVETKKMLLIK